MSSWKGRAIRINEKATPEEFRGKLSHIIAVGTCPIYGPCVFEVAPTDSDGQLWLAPWEFDLVNSPTNE